MERYIDLAKEYYQETISLSRLAELYMMEGNFQVALNQLDALKATRDLKTEEQANYSICSSKVNDAAKAEELLQQIINSGSQYNLGTKEYYQAYIASFLGQKEEAVELLVEAVRQGYTYGWTEFHNDFAFKDIDSHPQYSRILSYWH